jgi:uncharacterized protein YfaS (alpha-2-macroglobulin family)
LSSVSYTNAIPFLLEIIMSVTRTSACLATLLLACITGSVVVHAQNDPKNGPPQRITSLPVIDAKIHDAMQSRDYDAAIAAIDNQLAKPTATDQDYLLYLKGVAQTEAQKYEEAIATFARIEQEYADGSWISRARFGRANVYVLQRQYINAGKIYQQEAERLLSRGRKDELAAVYLEFADRYFEGVPAKDPSKVKQPDYQQALTYYSEAVKLGPTVPLRQKIEFRIARCQEELGSYDDAIKSYQRFLADHNSQSPASGTAAPPIMQAEASFNRGAAQLKAGQRAEARRSWQDFLASWQGAKADRDEQIEELLAQAVYRLAHTYGMPAPGSIGDLELGVAAAESFLRNHPNHELAATAELEIAQAYSQYGRYLPAVDRMASLIENPAYQDSAQVPVARRLLGQAYLTQRKFDDAIDAWKEFLDRHPTDPEWATVQKWIVDAEFAKADDAQVNKRYDEAQQLWQTFLNKYPLDARAPSVLFRFGQMKSIEAAERHQQRIAAALEKGQSAQSVKLDNQCEKLLEEAIIQWRRVVKKYPGHDQASRAAYVIGVTLEDRLGRLPDALAAYTEVKGAYTDQAKQRIAKLTSPQLLIATERKFRSNEKPRIKLTTRNLEKVEVKAYRIDMTDYFRKMHLASGVETLDIALIDPDAQFEHEVVDYQQYRRIEGDIEIPMDGPGVTAVTVASDKLEATTMLVVSDLDVIVKASRNELFLFAQNMKTGKPAGGASVLISNGSEVFAEEITADDGVLQKSYEQLKSVDDLRVFAIQAGHMASTVSNLNGLDFAVGLAPRGYLFTDRPAYRAGQLVNLKGVVRWVDGDRFTFQPGEKFTLDMYDARGRQIKTTDVELSGFGTISGNLVLPENAPQGDYRVHLHRSSTGAADKTGALSFETRFKVTEFKLEPIEVSIDLEKDVYFRGEQVTGEISLRYYYGTPLAGETVTYTFGGGETITATTDADGKIPVSLETKQFNESQPLQLVVNYPDRGLTRGQTVYLATRGFEVTASTVRDVYINGETFEVLFQVTDPAKNPVETKLKIELLEQTSVNGKTGERLVATYDVSTNKQTGQAQQTLAVDDGGMYIVRATAVDQFGNDVSGQHQLRISGDKDSVRLRILADRYTYHVGEEAQIRLHWREKPALALVTFEGAKVLGYQLVNLKSGENTLSVPMAADYAPNIFLSVAVMDRDQFHAATSQFQVTRKLNIALQPAQQELQPGEDLLLEIEVSDPDGKPVQAELTLAMVQTNLLDTFADVQGVIDEFFSTGRRQVSVRQSTSCTFNYRPRSRGVSQFLLAEADRIETLEREVRALARLDANVADNDRDGERVLLSDGAVFTEELWENAPGDAGVTPNINGLADSLRSAYQRQGQQQLQLQVVPQIVYRTEIVDGRKVQVPYTEQVTLDTAGNLPALLGDFAAQTTGAQAGFPAQTGQDFGTAMPPQYREQLAKNLWGAQRDLGEVPAIDAGGQYGWKFTPNNQSLNALQADGTFMVLNNRSQRELETLVAEQGVRLFPLIAHAETAYWDPHVVTDENGTATLTIPMPARSTAWRLRSKGVTNATLTGQASTELITKKDLFGEMKLPLAFTAGDQAEVPIEIHNSLDGERSIEVKLKAKLGEKSTEQTKQIEVAGPGIHQLSFPIEIDDVDEAEFSLQVTSGDDRKDTISQIVAIRPYGFPIYGTASGSASQSTLALLQLDQQAAARNPALEIVVGADVNRALLESVLGGGHELLFRCGLPASGGIERSVSDILGGVALLNMIGDARDADTPEAQGLVGKVSGAVAQLISSQRDDGGWNWSGRSDVGNPDRLLSARVMWALSTARKAGFVVAPDRFAQGQNFLKSSFSSTPQSALEQQTILLHAMAVSDCGDFAFANRLYRERNRLNNSGLVHLALALAALNHAEMANDLVDLVKFPAAAEDNPQPRTVPWMRNAVEIRAMYLLALEEINPRHPAAEQTADWLLAARVGSRWPVEKSNGPAIAALAKWYAAAQHVSEKYTLAISVNDQQVETFTLDPAVDGARRVVVPGDILHADKPQRIEFKLDGRGKFSYSAVLTAFVPADKIAATTKSWQVGRRYEPAQRMFDGVAVPRGFGVVSGGYQSFTNPLTQLPVGDRGEVTLSPRRFNTTTRADERYDYLVLTDPIPAGCRILDGSVTGSFERYEIQPGQVTFYIGDTRSPGDIRYTLLGYVPGEFRAPQSILRSFYDPSQFALSTVKKLNVLGSAEQTVDKYRLTPDELYYFGEKHMAKQEYQQAHEHLSQLFADWRLDTDKYKNTVHWLFQSSVAMNSHSDTVKYFEILKERFPDIELTFEDILKVAKSYQEIGEYERSYLVYRATVEGSFERESQVAGFLDARGQFIRSVQAIERLLRDYPPESYVATATYALAQEVYRRAPAANEDEKLKNAGITRVDLINGSINMLDHFVTAWPEDPANDQASFALATALIDLDQYDQAINRSEKYAVRYSGSRLLDSFWYMIGYCHFELEHHQQALQMCRKVAEATIPVPETGGTRAADNKWEAVYIMGQIYHSLGDAAEAITEYSRVRERFADAAEAIQFFSRKEIALDEVTTIKPTEPKQVTLRFRNLPEAAIKVYRIDLMKFGLMQRNLDRITAINLAGIKPYHEDSIKLGDGKDFRDREKSVTLPLKEEGAYLLVCRGENLYASGLVLVSPLTLQVDEDEVSGRVRVSVKDTTDDSFVDDVHVKVIGSANDDFQSGETDLRGLFIADDIKGTCTAIAVNDSDRYAFYRGQTSLQGAAPPQPAAAEADAEMQQQAAAAPAQQKASGKAILGRNIFNMNGKFQEVQRGNYDGLLNNDRQGVKSEEAY